MVLQWNFCSFGKDIEKKKPPPILKKPPQSTISQIPAAADNESDSDGDFAFVSRGTVDENKNSSTVKSDKLKLLKKLNLRI